MNNVKKAAALLLALVLIFAFPVTASAAETTEAKVPVTLTVINTAAPISCTVPACLPVSLIDGYIVTASNAAITSAVNVFISLFFIVFPSFYEKLYIFDPKPSSVSVIMK